MSEPKYITVRLPLQIGPMERGEYWEDPLADILQAQNIGEITGGGTMLAPEGGISYIDLEVALAELSDDLLDQVEKAMINIGAPKNTQFVDDEENILRSFGSISVVGIGLDGTDLPDSAYEGFDPDTFNDDIFAMLGDGHSYGGSHAGERYTFFYYHGPDGDMIADKLRDFARDKPICQGAQYVHIA